MSRLVEGLEAQGLVERVPGEGRSVPLRLTAEGQAAVRRLLDARRDALDPLLAPLDEGERAMPDSEIRVLLQRTDDPKVAKERVHLGRPPPNLPPKVAPEADVRGRVGGWQGGGPTGRTRRRTIIAI